MAETECVPSQHDPGSSYLIQGELAVSQRGQGDLVGAHQKKVAGATSAESRGSTSWRTKMIRMKTRSKQEIGLKFKILFKFLCIPKGFLKNDELPFQRMKKKKNAASLY